MADTNATNNPGGGWKRRLLTLSVFGKALNRVKRLLGMPRQLDEHFAALPPFQHSVEEQFWKLRESNTVLHQLLADVLPKMHQDAQAGRTEVAKLTNETLPDMRAASAEVREEIRRLKHRYAEYYGAIVEQLREQNLRLDRLAEQQAQILRLTANPTDVLPLEADGQPLSQAG